MSIIIANNSSIDDFYIISDTKIYIDESTMPCIIHEELAQNIRKFGLIKTIIITRHFSVSFAGDIIIANEFIGYLRDIATRISNPIEMLNFAHLYYDSKIKSIKSKCDFIIAIYSIEKISLYKFSDNASCVLIKRGYIGDSSVYKNFVDYSEIKIEPKREFTYNKSSIFCEIQLDFLDITPDGEKYQNLESMRSDMRRLKDVVDRGDNIYVDSPIIGIYFNKEREQFEYCPDIIYAVHGEMKNNGEITPVNINQYHSGESYEISHVWYNKGVVITYKYTNICVPYLYTYDYKDLGISDLEHLLLPLPKKGMCTVNIDYREG